MRLELAYIAAFLDCEGCVTIIRAARTGNEGYRYYGKLFFSSQNLAVLKDIQSEVGGNIWPPNTMVYVLQLNPRETRAALEKLIPFLRIKREQAETILELHRMIDATRHPGRKGLGGGGAVRLEESVYAARHILYEKVRELNHRDSKAFRANWENSVKPFGRKATPSQAASGESGDAEGVTTTEVSPNNNPLQEPPARKGRDSLSSAKSTILQ